MKKWAVLAGVSLLSAAAWLASSRHKPAPGENVPAPAAQQYGALDKIVAVPRRSGPPLTYGPLPTIGLGSCMKGPCPGGSVNDILSAHGRIWGYIGDYRSFAPGETKETYALLSDYLACLGLAAHDQAYCDYLPAAGSDARASVGPEESPNYACRGAYAGVSLAGYAAGIETGTAVCSGFLAGSGVGLGGAVSPSDFCAVAASGFENVCSRLSRYVPQGAEPACRSAFPAEPSDCGSAECGERLAVYKAMKARDPGVCPEGRRELCAAYLSRSAAGCSAVLARLGTFYCAALAKAQERTNGYAGYSPDEVKAAVEERARRLSLEDAQRREDQRIIEENNRKTRKILGK